MFWGFFVWGVILLIAHNRKIVYVSISEYAEAVLIYYMYAATGTLVVLVGSLQSWMFAVCFICFFN